MDGDMAAPGLTRYAALFVDVPNICTRGDRELGTVERLDVSRIDWPALFSLMLDSLGHDRVECIGPASAFAAPSLSQEPEGLKEALLNSIGDYRGKVSVVSSDKDIDALIVGDIWESLVKLSQMQYAGGRPFPHEATVLLAGGDGGYVRAIRQIRRTFGDLLDLRVHTFSWRARLSGKLSFESQFVRKLDHC